MRKFRLAFAAAGALVLAAAGLALATGGDSGTKSSRLNASMLAPTGGTSDAASTRASAAQTTRIALPGLTRPIRDMAPVRAGKHVDLGFREFSRMAEGLAASGGQSTQGVQTEAGDGNMPPPIQNFDGIARICGCLPPDTNGDVGPNHYMQWVNVHFAIYTKTGQQVGATQPGNALWAGNPNAPNCSVLNSGDPIVLYDQYANRWFASQFGFANVNTGPFYQCVAVSTTSDPSGTWCGYEYLVSANKLNDYPKFGVWPTQNAYTGTINQFTVPGFGWGGVGILAYERDKMLACQPAKQAYKDMLADAPALWGGMLPADADGPTLQD